MKRNRLLCLVLIYAFSLNLFSRPASPQNEPTTPAEPPQGLQFRLREAAVTTPKNETIEIVPGTKLSAAEADAIIRRLPPMDEEINEKSDFARREDSLPPPKTGKSIPVKFPADEKRAAPEPENPSALEVLRATPNGFVPTVKDLSITFSQPMIPVTAQAKAAENVPVELTPAIEGEWRWLGTNTLVFAAKKRFPMATKFTARVRPGARALAGSTLSNDFSWNFETPPPKVESFEPSGEAIRRDAVFFAKFNQQIDPEIVLTKISATANGEKIPLRLAGQSEIETDKALSEKIKNLPSGTWIAFRAAALLPEDARIKVDFEPGIESLEGPEPSVLPHNFVVKTYGALKLTGKACGYYERRNECGSYEPLQIEFNNPIDAASFDKSLVEIEPKLENAQISVSGTRLEISGCCKQTRRSYKVRISEKLKDVFGQTLGREAAAEFRIGAEEANLYLTGGEYKDLVTLDPSARPVFSVYSVNYKSLKVRLYAVNPEDYGKFYRSKQVVESGAVGNLVFDKAIKVRSKPDVSSETKIDLRPALKNGLGHAVLVVEPPVLTEQNKEQRILVWLEATQIGIDAFADYEHLTAYASDLKTGKPLNNVRLELSNGAGGMTNEDGLGTIALPARAAENGGWMIARNGADAAILLEDSYYSSDKKWARREPSDDLRWFVFDDRKMYRPGETVSVKGYLRKVTGGKITDIEPLGDAAGGLDYVLHDPRGNEILRGRAELNIFGAFDFQLKIPDTVNLGGQNLRLSTKSRFKNREFTHQFQVQEFRRPEFEVTAKIETAAPFYVGGSATVGVEAKYYAGGGLAGAATNWTLTSTPANYTPPNRGDFTFGKFVPWWKSYYENDYDQRTTQRLNGATNADGRHFLAVDFVAANPARPFLIKAEARVRDVNRQAFAGSTELLVHPSELYVGLRTPKTFVARDEVFKVETITTDIDGKTIANAPVVLVAELKNWEQIKGEWQEVTVDTQTCQIRSATEVVACDFKAKQGGTLTIKASVLDARQRRNESELTIWAAGGKSEPAREVEKESIELIPDKKEYAPNDSAEILVNAPFFPAEGVMTLRRNGIIRTERFTMNEASTVLRIPIEERFLPNVHVQVDLFGAAKRVVFENETDDKLPKRPAYASGALNLDVSTLSRRLTIAAEPVAKTLEPGGETSVNVAVADSSGKPASGAEVALVAVDESVLALTNYKIQDPRDVFYQHIEAGANDYYSRENVLLANPEDLLVAEKILGMENTVGYGVGSGMGSGTGSGSGDGDGDGSSAVFRKMEIITSLQRRASAKPDQIRMRRNFDALAVFSPSVKTDANGRATVKIDLPDNLTRYRITAIAADSNKFGKTESAITARQSLMVRPSAPRFLNFGDTAEMPIVLQNQTGKSLTVDVALRAANANLPDGNARRVTIPANERAELRFPVAVEAVGTARFQVGAVSGELADAAEFAFPVRTPATTEAFATYGTTEETGALAQSIEPPADVFPQYGGLEITTSSTQLQELTDAFLYLQGYPFECSEQVSSRILSVAALRDVLQAFNAKDLPSKERIEAKMISDIERLRTLQHADGGFSFWSSRDRSIPYVSVHVAHALARAKQKGYAVPPSMSLDLLNYLKNIETKYPESYSPESRRAISSYALYVRDLMGDKDAAKARSLLQAAGLENLSAESIGWLLSVLAGEQNSTAQVSGIKRSLLNRATETAAAAHFVTRYKDGEYVLLASERRADAVILEALLKVEPENSLIPKIVRGLLANKIKGRWQSTQENAFVLLALDKYFQTYEKTTPDFVARVWLGENFAGEQKFTGRSIDSKSIGVPMQFLQQSNAKQDLILDKQGAGRLYYRIGMKYAPRSLNLPAADYGFAVTRTYEAVDDPSDVKQNPDGSWNVKAGARVRVRLQMIAPTRRYHVALVDQLPAGFEIINSELAVSESLPDDENSPAFNANYNYYSSRWYDHQNLRDERAEVFKALLYEGVWNYSYIARATTPGFFVAAPAKAEEMYSPETFGRTRVDFVSVK